MQLLLCCVGFILLMIKNGSEYKIGNNEVETRANASGLEPPENVIFLFLS